jgi:hypothetical protein
VADAAMPTNSFGIGAFALIVGKGRHGRGVLTRERLHADPRRNSPALSADGDGPTADGREAGRVAKDLEGPARQRSACRAAALGRAPLATLRGQPCSAGLQRGWNAVPREAFDTAVKTASLSAFGTQSPCRVRRMIGVRRPQT